MNYKHSKYSWEKLKLFKKFMFSLGALTPFIVNVEKSNCVLRNGSDLKKKMYLFSIQESCNLAIAFVWDDTIEGFNYWNDIYEKYIGKFIIQNDNG